MGKIDMKRIMISAAAGLGVSIVAFIVLVSVLLLIQLMIAQFGSGVVALFGVWFVLLVVALSITFYYGIKK